MPVHPVIVMVIFSYLSTSSVFDQRVPEPPQHSSDQDLPRTRRDVSEPKEKLWEAIDESLAKNRFSPGQYIFVFFSSKTSVFRRNSRISSSACIWHEAKSKISATENLKFNAIRWWSRYEKENWPLLAPILNWPLLKLYLFQLPSQYL